MSILTVTFDGTVDAAGWTLVGGSPAHTLLTTVDQPASESTYVQATGGAAGILKLGIAPGLPGLITRITSIQHAPLLVSGLATGNFPLLRMRLVIGGSMLSDVQYDVDSAGSFFLAYVTHGPLILSSRDWYNGPRQLWVSTLSSSLPHDPIPTVP